MDITEKGNGERPAIALRLEIVCIWGWYEWREVNAAGVVVRRSGPQNLVGEQAARDHYTRVTGKAPPEGTVVISEP